MDYENMSDEKIHRLFKEAVPDLEIGEITDYNRETVVAFLKFLMGSIPTGRAMVSSRLSQEDLVERFRETPCRGGQERNNEARNLFLLTHRGARLYRIHCDNEDGKATENCGDDVDLSVAEPPMAQYR